MGMVAFLPEYNGFQPLALYPMHLPLAVSKVPTTNYCKILLFVTPKR